MTYAALRALNPAAPDRGHVPPATLACAAGWEPALPGGLVAEVIREAPPMYLSVTMRTRIILLLAASLVEAIHVRPSVALTVPPAGVLLTALLMPHLWHHHEDLSVRAMPDLPVPAVSGVLFRGGREP